MSEFCKQCSEELFGEDSKDFSNLGKLPSPDHGFVVLCEGCGETIVDEQGKCIDPYCKKHGHRRFQEIT